MPTTTRRCPINLRSLPGLRGLIALLALAALAAPAAAQPARRRIAPRSADSLRHHPPPAPRKPPVKNYDFLGDTLDGARIAPDGSTLFGLRGARHTNLIHLREHFLPEITRTAERLP